jgi:hypothetical protein
MTRAHWSRGSGDVPSGDWPWWQPPSETLETIAEIVAARWNAAKACYRESSFWPSATSWTNWLCATCLDEIRPDAYHFTRGGKLIK